MLSSPTTLPAGTLVKVLDLALPGYGYYPGLCPESPRRAIVDVFVQWISTVAGRNRRAPAARLSRTVIHDDALRAAEIVAPGS